MASENLTERKCRYCGEPATATKRAVTDSGVDVATLPYPWCSPSEVSWCNRGICVVRAGVDLRRVV